jgi:hypothetical protein
MQKRSVIGVFVFAVLIISVFSISFASAGFFGDLWGKVTGLVTGDTPECGNGIKEEGEICDGEEHCLDDCTIDLDYVAESNCSEPDWCDGYDLNQDGDVTLAEFIEAETPEPIEESDAAAALINPVNVYFGWHNCSANNSWCYDGDRNQDGSVTGTDLSIVSSKTTIDPETGKRVTNEELEASEEVVAVICEDSDLNDTFSKGYVSYEDVSWDACLNFSFLNEMECVNNTPSSMFVLCENGCLDGACRSSPAFSCLDSDGGVNFTSKGFLNATGFGLLEDSCLDNNTILEYYCDSNSALNVSFDCDCFGGECSVELAWCDGADIDQDGVVGKEDLDVLSDNYESFGCVDDNSFCNGADINRNGVVSKEDLEILSVNYDREDCIEEDTGFIEGVVEFIANLFGGGP